MCITLGIMCITIVKAVEKPVIPVNNLWISENKILFQPDNNWLYRLHRSKEKKCG